MTISPLRDRYELAIIGAGPAGMAAATTAAGLGIDAVLLDEQPSPGGQVYRGITEASPSTRAALGSDYRRGQRLVDALLASKAHYIANATVFDVSPNGQIAATIDGSVATALAKRLIVANGALERPFPIEGWTLPGVMTGGAAQILLKQADLVPRGRVVLAGTGPLLWLLAAQILRAGGAIELILDTTPRRNWRAALRHLPSFAISSYAPRGLSLIAQVRRRVRVVSGVSHLRALGDKRLSEVAFSSGASAETLVGADDAAASSGCGAEPAHARRARLPDLVERRAARLSAGAGYVGWEFARLGLRRR